MSTPGGFGSGGGADGTGPPTKRPKMDESDSSNQVTVGNNNMNTGVNALDNIFGTDNSGMVIPEELMQQQNQPSVSMNNPQGQQSVMNNGTSQLTQLLHNPTSQSNISMTSCANTSFRNAPMTTQVSMPMPVQSPNPIHPRQPSASPSPNPQGSFGHPSRSPAPANQQMNTGMPRTSNPNTMTNSFSNMNTIGVNQGTFNQFPPNPTPSSNNSQQHVKNMLQGVMQPNNVIPQPIMNRINMGPTTNNPCMGPNSSMRGMPNLNMNPIYRIMPPGNSQQQNVMGPMNPMNQNTRFNTAQQGMVSNHNPGGPNAILNNQVGSNQVVQQGNANNINQLNNTTDPDKRKMIQNQLIILIHAAKCQKRTDGNNDGQQQPCQIPHCQTMKNVLMHLPHCSMGRNCTIQHCASSRQIIAHWKQCKRPDCAVCQPLKPPPQQQPEPTPPNNPADQQCNNWRAEVNNELREHLVKKLVSAIFPTTDQNNERANDERINKLYNFARKVEEDMYKKASTREEYYHMLAEKIYKIQKELEQKRGNQANNTMPNNAQQNQRPSQLNQQQNPRIANHQQLQFNSPMVQPCMQNVPNGNPGTSNWPNQPQHPQQNFNTQPKMNHPIRNVNPIDHPNNLQVKQEMIQRDEHENMMLNKPMMNNQMINNQVPQTNLSQQQVSPIIPKTEKVEMSENPIIKTEPNSSSSVGTSLPSEPSPVPEKKMRMDVKEECDQNTVKSEIKTEPIYDASTRLARRLKMWSVGDLCELLMPVWQQVYNHGDAHPFQIPVDHVFLNLPDYPMVVPNPMDLKTIKEKLDRGDYKDPWGFVDDMWLMFENAWLYNRKTTRVYKMCTKLSEEFQKVAEPVMRRAGFCCSRKLTFTPLPLCCYGKTTCTINVGAYYYVCKTITTQFPDGTALGSDKIYYCEKCFTDTKTADISASDGASGQKIPKTNFEKKRNDEKDPEPFLGCIECGRINHEICVLHKKDIFKEGFTCSMCLKAKNMRRKDNRFTAKTLPECTLSKHIENRVNSMVENRDTKGEAGHVFIRVVFIGEKNFETRPGVRKEGIALTNSNIKVSEKYKYKAKALFAFEHIDNVDVCFFGLHVQEYGSECPYPNNRRVYIGYLDSVKFFQPAYLRTDVYHELLISYLEFTRNMGFVWAHIWACPPSEGDDYIFHCHPPEQRVPKAKRLQDWYKSMLVKAQERNAIVEFKDIFRQAKDDGVTNVVQLPYFDGDFWPNAIEDLVLEVEKEQQAEAATDPVEESTGQLDSKSKSKQQKKNQVRKKNNNKQGSDLMSKVMHLMERHKDVFFVIRMIEKEKAKNLPQIHDPDIDMQCELMDGRDPFLTKARDEHWEFSSLRRAKFSTMCLLHKLHNPDKKMYPGEEEFQCNECQATITTRYKCSQCPDYDVCTKCYEEQQAGRKEKHPHTLIKAVASHAFSSFDTASDTPGQTPAENRRKSIERCINGLSHAVRCRDANCSKHTCSKLKRVINHTKNCSRKKTQGQGCSVCKQFIALCCYHARRCEERTCRIPYCSQIKTRLTQQRDLQRRRQAQLMKRRMNMSLMNNDEPATPQPSTPQPATPKTPNPQGPCQGSKLSSKGGQNLMGTGKMAPSSTMNPFSPQPQQMISMQHQQQNQQGSCNQGPGGQGHPPMGAVIAAQEVVDIATQQTRNTNMGVANNQKTISQSQFPMNRPMTGTNGMGHMNPNHSMNPQYNPSNISQNQVMNNTQTHNTSQGTMFISNPASAYNQNNRPQSNVGSNYGPTDQSKQADILGIIRGNDPKDPKVLTALKTNPGITARLITQRNEIGNQITSQMGIHGHQMRQNMSHMRPIQGNQNMQMGTGMMMMNQPNRAWSQPNLRMQAPKQNIITNNMMQHGIPPGYRINQQMNTNMRMNSFVQQPPLPNRGYPVNINNMNMSMNMNGQNMTMNGPMSMNQMQNNQQMSMQQHQQGQINMAGAPGNYQQQRPVMSQTGQSASIMMNSTDQSQMMNNRSNTVNSVMNDDTNISNYKQIVENL